jgi:hypothetical protein
VIRLLGAGALALAFSASVGSTGAPLQCGSGHDRDPEMRREDSAGDTLYNLAQDFRAKGNEQAAKDTLRYLVDHFPSNRHTPAARAELGPNDAPKAATSEK